MRIEATFEIKKIEGQVLSFSWGKIQLDFTHDLGFCKTCIFLRFYLVHYILLRPIRYLVDSLLLSCNIWSRFDVLKIRFLNLSIKCFLQLSILLFSFSFFFVKISEQQDESPCE